MRFSIFENKLSLEDKFWRWFIKHADKFYRDLEKDQISIVEEIIENIEKVNPEISFEISSICPNTKKRELVISASGEDKNIPQVLKLTQAFPKDKLPLWHIVAFIQRKENCNLRMGDVEVGPDNVFFEPELNKDRLNIKVYVNNFDHTNPNYRVVWQLLHYVAGELEVMNYISRIEISKLENKTYSNLMPIMKLREIMDVIKNAKAPN